MVGAGMQCGRAKKDPGRPPGAAHAQHPLEEQCRGLEGFFLCFGCVCGAQNFEIPTTFEGFSALVVKWLSPVEQLSPFKVGQIQKLISQIAESAG